jgi:hypothetical protein
MQNKFLYAFICGSDAFLRVNANRSLSCVITRTRIARTHTRHMTRKATHYKRIQLIIYEKYEYI